VIDDNKIDLRRAEYPVEETIARLDAMPWPSRAKEILGQVLRLGRLPSTAAGDGVESTIEEDAGPDDFEEVAEPE
jgi:hypothetical protein